MSMHWEKTKVMMVSRTGEGGKISVDGKDWLIGFLPNKESIRGAWVNPMHFHSLRELASEEPSESGRTSSSTKETSCIAPATRLEAPTRLG